MVNIATQLRPFIAQNITFKINCDMEYGVA